MARTSKLRAAKKDDLVVVSHDTSVRRQWEIENHPQACLAADYDHERDYVHIGGYFGAHNPHTFAAAPLLLKAAKALLTELTDFADAPALGKAIKDMRAACVQAEGLG